MKIRLSHLRSLIRESLEEQGWVPGRWYPGTGEPVDPDDVELMGTGGLGDEDEELKEATLTVRGLKKTTFEDVAKRFPKFASELRRNFDDRLDGASFALSSQGLLGKKLPAVAFRRGDPAVAYWDTDDNMVKYSSSESLVQAIESAK